MGSLYPSWSDHIIPIRGVMGYCHILLESDGRSCTLLDTGLWGELFLIKAALAGRGLTPQNIRAIVLTHGHLDHTGNLCELKRISGAPIYAHPLEQPIIDGEYEYRGINAWCGRLESLGRSLMRVGAPARIDVPIQDAEILPFFGGLRVVHLPGHTMGHCGFFRESDGLFFCGDLFASYPYFSHQPAPILNTAPELMPRSIALAQSLNPKLVIPQHYDIFDPLLHLRRFQSLCLRAGIPPQP